MHSDNYVSCYLQTHSPHEAKARKSVTGETAQLFLFKMGSISWEAESFLSCLPISIIGILWKHSMSRNKMLPSPHALSGVGCLILGHWGSGPRPTQQHVPWSQDLGRGHERRWLLLRFTRDITYCHLTMWCFLVLPKSVETIFLFWLYFQAFDSMVTNFNNLAKCPSESHSIKLKSFPSLVQSLLTYTTINIYAYESRIYIYPMLRYMEQNGKYRKKWNCFPNYIS